jgi:hypothetical protein
MSLCQRLIWEREKLDSIEAIASHCQPKSKSTMTLIEQITAMARTPHPSPLKKAQPVQPNASSGQRRIPDHKNILRSTFSASHRRKAVGRRSPLWGVMTKVAASEHVLSMPLGRLREQWVGSEVRKSITRSVLIG